jgi:crossover junction endodeoxyribonuclease RuvC
MIIMAVDPGTLKCGISIFKDKDIIYSEQVEIANSKISIEKRLALLYNTLTSIYEKYHPEQIALEDGYIGTNKRTSMTIGLSRGIVMLIAGMNNIRVYCYPPSVVKKTFTGKGNIDKNGIIAKANELTNKKCAEDEADSIAIGYTHYVMGVSSNDV